tara:strand:+ start:1508 stop:1729 length:222 start_codon:yes stop_codon:yes gene_type:complete
MWKVYKYNGHYIQGDLVSKHTTESAAIKKAKKVINFTFSEKVKRKNEILIWLDGKDYLPLGVIVKKQRGAKNE